MKGREGLHIATDTLIVDSLDSQLHLIRSFFRISNHFRLFVDKSNLCVIGNTLPLSLSRKRRQFVAQASVNPVFLF